MKKILASTTIILSLIGITGGVSFALFGPHNDTYVSAAKERKKHNGLLPAATIDEVITKSEIIAKLKITKLVKVHEEQGQQYSEFEAEVEKYYKDKTGKLSETVRFFQHGSPEADFIQDPLLEENKKYVLFLDEVDTGTQEFGKALIMTNGAYGRFNIDGDSVVAQLKHITDEEKRAGKRFQDEKIKPDPMKYSDFEKLLSEKMNKKSN
ncbi:hypothetical protein [Brevibacillus sp. H7]|uniref:hypothetical protein n=1 Tax=Brevibacillus sp. H7 TaxID=3349138 RepID=UPI0038165B54